MSDIRERLHTGEIYFPGDEEITKEQRVYQDLLYEYNQTRPSEGERRTELRQKGLQYNMSVQIGRNCWIGAGAIIMPGINIGDNVVIGAGSVVTRDIPSNVVAVGNPCRVMREVGERDRKYYFRDREINPEEWEK